MNKKNGNLTHIYQVTNIILAKRQISRLSFFLHQAFCTSVLPKTNNEISSTYCHCYPHSYHTDPIYNSLCVG
jgi:hypothetical protein